MLRFIVKRFGSALLVMFAISVLVFLIFFATPGVDPAARIAGRNADPATLAQVRHSFGLDRPMPIRYLLMMRHLLVDRDLESFVNRGSRVIPQIVQATPVFTVHSFSNPSRYVSEAFAPIISSLTCEQS